VNDYSMLITNKDKDKLIEEIEEICVTTLLACALLSAFKKGLIFTPHQQSLTPALMNWSTI